MMNDKSRSLILAASLAFFLLSAGCTPEKECSLLLDTRCLHCHNLDITCAKIGQTNKQWLGILDAMIRLQADLSEKERTMLAQCLSAPSRDIAMRCE